MEKNIGRERDTCVHTKRRGTERGEDGDKGGQKWLGEWAWLALKGTAKEEHSVKRI